ncbi:MAG TPA: glycosyltransferase family 2 protein [Solirubrobacterales bacterium]|nr:glycosyltransferase family 2 protein [Solirubrobacterales bacterium]
MSGQTRPAAALSAIVVTHDSAHVLPAWLAALDAVIDRDQVEVCVVDSGSSEEQLALIEAQAEGNVDVVLRLGNVGFGRACNAGADATGGSVVLFANPDVRLRSLPQRALDGGLGDCLLGAFALDPSRPLGFERLPSFSDEARRLLLGRWFRPYQRCAEHPAWVSGAAMLIERATFRQLTGFSPEFFMYFEDADLCARHRRAGGALALDRDFVVEHGHGASVGEELQRSLAGPLDGVNRLSARRFARRHGGAWQAPLLYLLLLLSYAPRRLAAELVRERRPLAEALDYVACLLRPGRALRRLQATDDVEAVR